MHRVWIREAVLHTTISVADTAPPGAYDMVRRLVEEPGDGSGQWATLPDHITVGTSLRGGRHGAEVFEITAEWRGIRWRYVVKMGPAAEMAKEWQARKLFEARTNTLCAPLELATPGVLDFDKARSREAVVYGHVQYVGGDSERPLETLADLAEAAYRPDPGGLDRVVRAIASFATAARTTLYNKPRSREHRTSLRNLVTTLGPCLAVEIERIGDVEGAVPVWGATEVLENGLAPDLAGAPLPDRVHLEGLKPIGAAEDRLVQLGEVRLEIRPSPGGPDLSGLTVEFPALCRVVDRYAPMRWTLITQLCPELEREGLEIVCGAERTELPFARLLAMLTAQEQDRVVSLGHGDANARNILFSGDRPFLIDFAKSREDLPLLADFCWLELGLLRDVIASHHDFAELLTLQRWLGLATRSLDAVGVAGAEPLANAFAEFIGDTPLSAAFRILWEVRREAHRVYPDNAGPVFWRDYLCHLTIEANRMLKWPAGEHSAAEMRATVAAAGVAGELWGARRPFRAWRTGRLMAISTMLASSAVPDTPCAVELMAALAREIDHRNVPEPGRAKFESALTDFREKVVRCVFTDTARQIVATREDHEAYFPLAAHDVNNAPVGQDVQELLADGGSAILVGPPGSGKSTVLQERRYRLAEASLNTRAANVKGSLRLPVLVNTPDPDSLPDADQEWDLPWEASLPTALLRTAWQESGLPDSWADHLSSLITLGAICFFADGLDQWDESAFSRLVGMAERVPRGSMIICLRSRSELPHAESFRTLAMAEPAPEALERYIGDMLQRAGLSDYRARAHRMVSQLLTDWLGVLSPRLLLPIVTLARRDAMGSRPIGPGEVIEQYVQHLVGPRQRGLFAVRDHNADKDAVAAHLGRAMVDGRLAELKIDDLDRILADAVNGDWRGAVDDLVTDEVLRRSSDGEPSIRFARPVLRDYFAARWLLEHWSRPESLDDRVADFHWREAIKLVLSLARGDEAMVAALVTPALRYDLEPAASFLRAAATPGKAMIRSFVEIAERRLMEPDTHEDVRRDAATGLAMCDDPLARRALETVVVAATAPIDSRIAALESLANLASSGSGPARRTLRRVIPALLSRPADVPTRVLVAAAHAARRGGIPGTVLHLAELIGASHPWSVSEAAMQAVRAFNVDVPERLCNLWAAGCRLRLEQTELEIVGASGRAEQVRLTEERRRLLTELADARMWEPVLRHRFRFDLDDHVAGLLERWSAQDQRTAMDLFDSLTDGDETTATTAAHRLLPSHARGLVSRLASTTPAGKPLAIAAAIFELDPTRDQTLLDQVERVVDELAAGPTVPMEPLAALTSAVFAIDRPRGLRLTLRTARTLEERDVAERRAWPWTIAFSRAVAALPDLIALLLSERPADAKLAVFGLSAQGFLVEAGPGPLERIESSDRARFLELRPGSTEAGAWHYVMAAASLGVAEVLSFALDLASSAGVGTTPFPLETGALGQVLDTELAGVLAAVGYLARLSGQQGDTEGATRAEAFLAGFRTEGLHPSVAAGRLAGLAYLGNWREVLKGSGAGDRRTLRIMANAIFRWSLDAEHAAGGEALEIAARLAELVQGNDLPPDTRAALWRLQRDCEHWAGFYIRAGHE